ncbi:hypothetical protein [Curtobacterium sp. MCJR17_020]|uniref:hypothetical protein n=1 Tax=Curtobacterium sp. MCJR17_020 TaxID=2175619 RepID=UPI000DA8C818|nr:hypothetical protein [Curtobacterium sp. MCJR17_020]WIE71603.1 hypothetical protein DEJ14_015650 [Curtobacterium sp. MCJR17_020]
MNSAVVRNVRRSNIRKAAYQGTGIATGAVLLVLAATTSTTAWLDPSLNRSTAILNAIGDLGLTLIDDAGWFLPLLCAMLLGIIGLLLGQSKDAAEDDGALRLRRRLALSAWAIAGICVAHLVIVIVAVVNYHRVAPHLWSAAVTTVLLTGGALWIGIIVLGTSHEQLRLTRSQAELVEVDLQHIPADVRPASGKRRALLLIVTVSVITSTCSIGIVAMLGQTLDPPTAIIIDLLVAVTWSTAMFGLCWLAALISRPVGSRILIIVGATAPAASWVASVTLADGISITQSAVDGFVAMLVPSAAALMPRTWFGGWTYQDATLRMRRRALLKQSIDLCETEAHLRSAIDAERPLLARLQHARMDRDERKRACSCRERRAELVRRPLT